MVPNFAMVSNFGIVPRFEMVSNLSEWFRKSRNGSELKSRNGSELKSRNGSEISEWFRIKIS